jgi:hypothetical protein
MGIDIGKNSFHIVGLDRLARSCCGRSRRAGRTCPGNNIPALPLEQQRNNCSLSARRTRSVPLRCVARSEPHVVALSSTGPTPVPNNVLGVLQKTIEQRSSELYDGGRAELAQQARGGAFIPPACRRTRRRTRSGPPSPRW